jgi:hypothetical protein
MSAALQSKGEIVIAVASNGFAALLILPGGRTTCEDKLLNWSYFDEDKYVKKR